MECILGLIRLENRNSRLWILRANKRSDDEKNDNGRDALLDGARSCHKERVWPKSRHLEFGHHGDRND